MRNVDFNAIEIDGFNIFGETILDNIAAYSYYRKTGEFKIYINQDTSVMYIGTARK